MLKSFKSVIYTNDKSLPSRFSCNFTPVSQIFLSVWKLFNQPSIELHEAVFVRRQSLGCSEHQASLFSAWHHDSKDLLWGFWAPRSGCRMSMKTTCCTVAAAFRLNIQCVCVNLCVYVLDARPGFDSPVTTRSVWTWQESPRGVATHSLRDD